MRSGAVLGLLDTVTFPELLTVLVIGLVVLGPEKLPGMARQVGEWMAKLRSVSQNLQREMGDVLDDPEMQSLRELGEFAARPRAKIAEYARSMTDVEPDANSPEPGHADDAIVADAAPQVSDAPESDPPEKAVEAT